jgi:hypothetical protein
LEENILPTLRRIWVAKAATVGGASGSKRPILKALTDSSKYTRECFVSTVLGLGIMHRNRLHSLEKSLVHLFSPQLMSSSALKQEMAFQRADPRPFDPPRFHHQEVHHIPVMTRVFMHAPRIHEDYAIISIAPIPNHNMHFPVVREVIEEFLVEHMYVGVRNIQPSHLGPALVRFENIFDRNLLVNNSPHPYGGVSFTMVHHNAARNWRAIQFN